MNGTYPTAAQSGQQNDVTVTRSPVLAGGEPGLRCLLNVRTAPRRSPIRAGLDAANHHPHLTGTRRSRLVTHGSRRLDGKTERARTGQIWQLFATKEAAEKAAERLNSRGYDVIVTTAELAK
jgi:hypothetical protein